MDEIFGRFEVIGKSSDATVFKTLASLAELMESVQPEIFQVSVRKYRRRSGKSGFSLLSVSYVAPAAVTRT